MRNIITKLTGIALGLVVAVAMLVPSVASAQATGNGIWQSKPTIGTKITTQYAVGITSGTSVANDLPPVSVDASKKVDVGLVGTAASTSVSINLYNGTDLVATQVVNVTTAPAVTSFAAPVTFDLLTVSPTAGLTGTNSLKAFVMQPK